MQLSRTSWRSCRFPQDPERRFLRELRSAGCSLFVASALISLAAACSDPKGHSDEEGVGGASGDDRTVRRGDQTRSSSFAGEYGAGEPGDEDSAREESAPDASDRVVADGAGHCSITEDEHGCTGQAYEGESMPLDIYVLFDQSGSMCNCVDPPKDHNACPDPECRKYRIEAIREAMDAFLRAPESAGIGVGIGYFGQQAIGSTTCDPADYPTAVEIGTLPRHADVLMESLQSVEPTGETPTGPAIEAACASGQEWLARYPGHKLVLLLLTDGEPKAPVTCSEGTGPCCPTLADAITRTEACRQGKLPIDVYVLGVGPFLDNLAGLAEAGGTRSPYLVQDGDVSERVLEALNAIRGDAGVPCQMPLPLPPTGELLAYDKVNLVHASATCSGTVFRYVDSEEDCGDSLSWYYDDPAQPEIIHLCPESCELARIPGGKLLQSVGCTPYAQVR